MRCKIALLSIIFFICTDDIKAGQPQTAFINNTTKTMQQANKYIEYIEAELRGIFPGYQSCVNLSKTGAIKNFLEDQIKKNYIPKPKTISTKKHRKKPMATTFRQWKSTNEYIEKVLIPDLKAVFGEKNMKKRVRFFRETEHVGWYVKTLIKRFYTKKKK